MEAAEGEQSLSREFLTSCGTYNWHVQNDRLQVDEILANFLDLSAEEAEHGVPLHRFLAAIHKEDRARVEKHIRHSIETGDPCRQAYRLCSVEKGTIPVVAMGQCFRDKTGEPADYAGMIFEAQSYGAHRDEEGLVEHCLAAYASAREADNEIVTYLLSMVLLELGYTHASAALEATRH